MFMSQYKCLYDYMHSFSVSRMKLLLYVLHCSHIQSNKPEKSVKGKKYLIKLSV